MAKSINVLEALYFMTTAWQEVSSNTWKLFEKTGFLQSNADLEHRNDGSDYDNDLLLSTVVETSRMITQATISNVEPDEIVNIHRNLVVEDETVEITLPNNLSKKKRNL